MCLSGCTDAVPSLSAPARPRMTVTGLEGFVQNWCSGGKKASLLFSSCGTETSKHNITTGAAGLLLDTAHKVLILQVTECYWKEVTVGTLPKRGLNVRWLVFICQIKKETEESKFDIFAPLAEERRELDGRWVNKWGAVGVDSRKYWVWGG